MWCWMNTVGLVVAPCATSITAMSRALMRPPIKRCYGLALLALALPFGSALAAPSTIDGSWGVDGTVAVPVGGIVTKIAHQSDGSIIALSENAALGDNERLAYLMRITPQGQIDTSFSGGSIPTPCVIGTMSCAAKVNVDAQDRIWVASGTAELAQPLQIRRYLPGGAADTSFANNGLLLIDAAAYCPTIPCGYLATVTLSVTPHASGRALVTLACTSGPLKDVYGTCVIGLGPTGAIEWTLTVPAFHQSLYAAVVDVYADGGAILGGSVVIETPSLAYSRPALLKIKSNGERDGSFGNSGLAVFDIQDFRSATQVAALDGGGAMFLINGDYGSVSTLLRVTAGGGLAPGYGAGGMLRMPIFKASDMTLMADESVVTVGSYQAQAAVMRLRPDGTPETRFAGAGMAVFPFTGGSGAKSVFLRPSGRIVAGGFLNVGTVLMPPPRPPFPTNRVPVPSPLVFQIEGGLEATPQPWAELVSVEYYNRAYGHYFMTANGEEMQSLDLAPEQPWKRTGKSFSVWNQVAAELSDVCRFWSGQTFAPKSSHFYTPYAAECAGLRQPGSVWTYEGNAFSLRLPEGPPGATTCPEGSRPLYRAYNNGIGGAPNHRYTTEVGVLDSMVRQGWTMEGDGVTRIFACTSSR